MSQLEMRIAAYASGDPTMIAACEGSDLHSANATVIFGAAFTECTDPVARKGLRTMAKSSGFAVCYMAEASTVFARLIAEGANVTLRQVEAMLAKMRRAFLTYYRWQDAALLDTVRTGYVYTPILGRRRWLGHDPSPTECANFPIQGGAADYMNERFPEVVERCDAEGLGVEPVAQVHDSGVLEVPEEHVPRVCELVREVNARPIVIASSGEPLSAVLPIDLEDSERWH
jgi:DNA polymerase I-like protein with 3'-5' exonuclease and polymerase domains